MATVKTKTFDGNPYGKAFWLCAMLVVASMTCASGGDLSAESVGASATFPPLYGDGVHDDTAAIQARLDSGRACVYLPPPASCYLISRPLELHSDQELRLDRYSVVRLAPKSDCRMVVNKNWKTGDRRVALTGGIWDMDNLRQSPNPMHTERCNPPRRPVIFDRDSFDRNLFTGDLMAFDNVEGLSVCGITLRNPTTYSLHLTRTSYFLVDDVTFDFTTWNPIPLNLDGVHLAGGCHHGRISNLRGTTYDDMVALTANDYPFFSSYDGPIHDIDIDGIYADYCHSAVRMLSAGEAVSRVTVRNVHGNFYVYAIGLTHYFQDKPRGRFDDIVIENVFTSKVLAPEGIGVHSREKCPLVVVEDGIDVGALSVRNFNRVERNIPIPSVRVCKDARVDRLTIRDCRMENRLEKPIAFLDIAGTVKTLTAENNELVAAPGHWTDGCRQTAR